MPPSFLLLRVPVLFAWLLLPLSALAQTLAISEGVQTYATLSGTTVTMTGKSELRLTASASALTNCVVHLNSSDAALLFVNVKPSTVASTYLSQLRVNGSAAASGTNCRVVQYAQGTLVLPHAPSFQPLQAWSGPSFTGTSAQFSQYTYYNTAASLGSLNKAISSFKLKRGYMATVSTQQNGTGPSKNYVAQDGDLEVSLLPSQLDNAIQYVRVFPWRWVSKKGVCDTSPTTFNAGWFYNWNNDGNNVQSTLDYEFVPIRQQRWWPAYPTNKPESNHLLGFNEPNNSVEDAYQTLNNGDVNTAIAVWPELLANGLRVGSPAPTDAGRSWLYDFVNLADSNDLRVDYVAIHMYQCGHTASSLYNWLKAIYDATGRPIWVTEFNNGANWTTCADPTQAQNAAAIQSFIDMMDNAPFIERYSIYSAVEEVRQLTDANGITATGVVYRDNVSPIGHVQAVPATGTRGVAQLSFDGHTRDASGFGNNGFAAYAPSYATGRVGQSLVFDGTNNFVQLPDGVATSAAFSFAAWVYWDGGANWQRIFDFNPELLGANSTRYLFLTPSNGSGIRFAIRNGGSEQTLTSAAPLAVGQWQHVAVTLSGGVARMYLNGVQAASAAISIAPSQFAPKYNYLGKSTFPADPLFRGRLDDVRIADYAFTASQIATMAAATNSSPQFSTAMINGGNATQGVAYTGSVAGAATDADTGAGDTLVYSKATGPSWLVVSANGALSGTPAFADEGVQEFVIAATDSTGAAASVVFTVTLPSILGSGTWTADAAGTWADTTKWASGFPANGAGYIADFSTLNITADRTVVLNSSRSIGTLRFGDTSGAQNWTLASSGGATLTLDTGTTASPSVVVSQNTASLTTPLAGTSGFTKSGTGTLVLAGANSLSGTVNIDSGSNTSAEGTVRLAHPNALASATALAIRTNNSGSSTLALDGSLGDILSPATLSLSGRNNLVAAIRNLSGANTLGGTLTLQSGGANYSFQSDAGSLTLGAVTSAASGTRTLTFSGAGDFILSGVVANGSATDGVVLVKNGAGRLALTAASTFTGSVTVNAGILSLLGSGALYAGGWNNTAVLTVNSGAVLELDRWGYGPNGTYRTQSLGGLDYNPARFVINGGTLRYSGGAAGAPLNPGEAPYGPGFTIGAAGAVLEASKVNDTWTVKNDSRGTGPLASAAGGTLTLSGAGNGVLDKVLPGTGGLIKTGAGTWTLPLANTYTGPTSVNAGILRVTGSIANGAVTVANGGTLGGTGSLGGALAVQSGGTLAPGSGGIGRLTVAGGIGLQNGAFASLEINKTAGIRDVLATPGTLTLDGTLVVTNLGGTLADGDSFALFEAGSFSGAFDAYVLPALPSGLEWDTAGLAVNGTLAVKLSVATYPGWAAGYSFPSGQEGAAADPDADGIANAFEWLFDGDPLAPDPALQLQPVLRTLSTAEFPGAEAGKHYLTLSARIRKNRSGMTLTPQAAASPDLFDNPLAVISVTSFVTQDLGDFEDRTWVCTQALEDSPTGRAFMRLKLVSE